MRLSELIFLLVSFFISNLIAAPEASQIETPEKNQKVIELLSSRVETLTRAEIIQLSKAYSAQKQHLFAIKTLSVALSKNPLDFEVLTLRGEQEFFADKINEALLTLKEALEINSKYEPAFLITIKIYEKRKNRYELRLAFQDMVEKMGEKQLYLERLCEITTLDGLYELSLNYCRKGATKFSKSDIFPNFLGVTLMETGKSTEADGVFNKATLKFPKSKLLHVTYAEFLFKRQDYVKAYGSFLKASLVDNQNYEAHLGLGKAAVEIQKYKESLEAFKQACNLKKVATVEIRKVQAQLKIQKKPELEKSYKSLLDSCPR